MFSRTGHTLVIIIITIIGIDLNAQSLSHDYNFKHLNVQNGLVQNIVYRFLQDSRGFMWIGTHNGVTLYDGTRTTNFLHDENDSTSVGGNFITNILEDSSQQVWIGNEAGIDLYNRADNTFSHYSIPTPDGKKDKVYCVLLGFTSATDLWFLETKGKSLRSLNTKTQTISFIADLNATAVSFYKNPITQTVHTWSYFSNGTIHQVFIGYKLIKQETFFTGKDDSSLIHSWRWCMFFSKMTQQRRFRIQWHQFADAYR